MSLWFMISNILPDMLRKFVNLFKKKATLKGSQLLNVDQRSRYLSDQMSAYPIRVGD